MNFIENDSFSIGKTHTKRELCNPKEGIIVGDWEVMYPLSMRQLSMED